MSASDEASGFDPEGGEPGDGSQAGPGAPPGLGAGVEWGPPSSGQGEAGLLDNQGQALQSQLEAEAIEAGGSLLSGREGRPGSLAKEKGVTQDLGPHLPAQSAAAEEPLTVQQAEGIHRYPSPESFAAELLAIWAYAEAGQRGRGEMGLGSVEAQHASAASYLHASGPEGGWAWDSAKRGTERRMKVRGAARPPSSDDDDDEESADEFTEIQLMRSKHLRTGKTSMARRTRESQPMEREDNDPNRDGGPQAQLPAPRPGPPFLFMDFGEFTSGYPDTRAPQPPGYSHTLALSQRSFMARGLTPSGDQEPPVQPPVPERQLQAPGAQGCPRCVVLQKEIDYLKEQLAAMQSLNEKFQALGS